MNTDRLTLNNTQLGYKPLIPYVIDNSAFVTNWASQLLPTLNSYFSVDNLSVDGGANLTEFPTLGSIVEYQRHINDLHLYFQDLIAPPRPSAGYEINQIASSSDGLLNFGYTLLQGINP